MLSSRSIITPKMCQEFPTHDITSPVPAEVSLLCRRAELLYLNFFVLFAFPLGSFGVPPPSCSLLCLTAPFLTLSAVPTHQQILSAHDTPFTLGGHHDMRVSSGKHRDSSVPVAILTVHCQLDKPPGTPARLYCASGNAYGGFY